MKSIFRALALMLSPLVLTAQTLPGGFHAAYVEGHVFGSDTGKPLTGAKIDVIGANVTKSGLKAGGGCGEGFALSASNGNFAVGVGQSNLCVDNKHPINGNYYVSVSKRGYLPSIQHIDFGTRNTNVVGGLIFRLTPAHATIVGHVLSRGTGVPYAYVWVMPDVWAMIGQKQRKQHLKGMLSSERPMVRTDAHGAFQIPVSPGSYVVMAGKAGYQLVTKTVNPALQHWTQSMQAMMAKLPPQYRGSSGSFAALQQPQLGASVTVATGETVVANLVLAKLSSPLPAFHQVAIKNITGAFTPHEMLLVGQARLEPNNVMFYTLMHPGRNVSAGAEAIIVRSRVLLGGGKIDPLKDRLKVLSNGFYGLVMMVGCQTAVHYTRSSGECTHESDIFSFTDSSAKPGVTYYYYIFEGQPYVGTGMIDYTKIGLPHSNALPLLTHGIYHGP